MASDSGRLGTKEIQKKSSDYESLKGRLEGYRSRMAYVTSSKRLTKMKNHLLVAQQHLDNGELPQAFEAFYLAKREFILARKNRQVYYFRSSLGMLLAVALAFLFSIGILGLWLLQDTLTLTIAPLLAALGGGIGGSAAVLIQAIDVDPETEAVSQTPWYVIKPILGAALGLITYFAVVSGLNVIAQGAEVSNFEGAVVIGFLAGFFESFSTGILARIAGQFTDRGTNGVQTDMDEESDTDKKDEIPAGSA
jgi:hypothetical protein